MQHVNDLRAHLECRRQGILDALARVIDRGWVVLGPEVEAFERSFAHYAGASCCVGVGNGTDALELALRALAVAPGQRVATAANAGMYATAAILAIGAEPLFLDVDAEFGHLRAADVAKALDAGAAAVVVTHLYGRMAAELPHIVEICRRRGVPVIEDCAQAHGARAHGKMAGCHGSAGCFSFYPTKNLGAIGDAGAILTDDAALAQRVRQLRQYGWGEKYHARLRGGRNSRLDEVQAAVLSCLLPELDAMNSRRKAIARAYFSGLRHPALHVPVPGDEDDVAHLFVVRTAKRDRLRAWLEKQGVKAEIHYPIPDYRQAALAGDRSWVSLPNTERLAAEVLTLPCYPELDDLAVQRIIEAVNAWPG